MISSTVRQERTLQIPAEWSFSVKKQRAARLLLAESGSSFILIFGDLNVRFGEKRTFGYLTENLFNP